MKFVGNTLNFSGIDGDAGTHTIHLPFYHRAAIGVFPGTRLFAVPLASTNEVVLTPIHPSTWGDLWRLEATVKDEPGSAKKLVETLVENDVNVLVHEGVSESAERGRTVHQVFEILDLAKYVSSVDRSSTERNSVEKPLLKPNHLINTLIAHSADCLDQARDLNGWEMRFERMDFFFRNKEDRVKAVELSLNVDNEVHVPGTIFRDFTFVDDVGAPLPLHIISDTEQKYVKLRVLSPRRYYLLFEIEHDERVGAIDDFMGVFRSRNANIIDSYSRLKSISHSALFYSLAEFSTKMSIRQVVAVVKDLVNSSLARAVALKGAVGAGPTLEKLESKLPGGATIQPVPPSRPTPGRVRTEISTPEEVGDQEGEAPAPELGVPYYVDRPGSRSWTLNTAQVFMAIPFSEAYEEFYDDFVANPVREVGLEPIRVDRMPAQAKRRHIIDRIEEGIARSRFVVADVTGWNANVVYEVGLAAAISKPILSLCDSRHFDAAEIPFDFKSYELIKYTPYRAGDLKIRLTEKVRQLKEVTEPTA